MAEVWLISINPDKISGEAIQKLFDCLTANARDHMEILGVYGDWHQEVKHLAHPDRGAQAAIDEFKRVGKAKAVNLQTMIAEAYSLKKDVSLLEAAELIGIKIYKMLRICNFA